MLDFGFYNMDCMEGMKEFPDKYFDLAIVDPPYGDALENRGGYWNRFGERFDRYIQTSPTKERQTARRNVGFRELAEDGRRGTTRQKNCYVGRCPRRRVFQRTFPRLTEPDYLGGGNYFKLPPTRCFLIWEKVNIPESFTMAMCEYAWTSFNDNAKIFKYSAANQPGRFHPTQKPVELYKWLLMNYAKNGETILDTHTGSASSLIACRQTNHKYVGFEIDAEYYKKARKRLEAEESQMNLWDLGFNPYQE